jgi:hypothetical protein
MAITTLDGFVGGAKQRVTYAKTTARTVVANSFYSLFDIAGNPGAGTLSAGNTANGIVHTDATGGYPAVNAFGGSATGYLGRAEFANTVASRLRVIDRVFSCGAYAYNAATTLSAAPSFLGRIPGGTALLCAGCTELWVETVTNATGNLAVTVTYYNELGVGGGTRTTGAIGIAAAPVIGRMWQLPLQAGDKGVSQILSVTGTVASAGTFNVHVVRPLAEARVSVANMADIQDFIRTGMPIVYADSALMVMVSADSTGSGLYECAFDVVNG